MKGEQEAAAATSLPRGRCCAPGQTVCVRSGARAAGNPAKSTGKRPAFCLKLASDAAARFSQTLGRPASLNSK